MNDSTEAAKAVPQAPIVRPRHQWQPGQSGNPSGVTSETRRLALANAERATRIRARVLQAVERVLSHPDTETGDALALRSLTTELLTLLRDAETRGYGAPTQRVEVDQADPLQAVLAAVHSAPRRLHEPVEDAQEAP